QCLLRETAAGVLGRSRIQAGELHAWTGYGEGIGAGRQQELAVLDSFVDNHFNPPVGRLHPRHYGLEPKRNTLLLVVHGWVKREFRIRGGTSDVGIELCPVVGRVAVVIQDEDRALPMPRADRGGRVAPGWPTAN